MKVERDGTKTQLEYAAPPQPILQNMAFKGYDQNEGTDQVLTCFDHVRPRQPSRIVRIYPGPDKYEVPEVVNSTRDLFDWLKGIGCKYYRRAGAWRELSEPILMQLPPKFAIVAKMGGTVQNVSNLDLEQAVRRALEQDSSARTELRLSAMASSRVSSPDESCPELLMWSEQIIRRQVPRVAVSIDELLVPLRPLAAELRYLHFLLFEAKEASLEKVLQTKSSRTGNQAVYHPLFLQFCRGAASGQPDIMFDKDIRVLAAGTSQPSELEARFHCAEQGDVTGGIDSNKFPFAKMLKHNMNDPQPWHLGIFVERVERVWFALFTYRGSDGGVDSLTVAPPFNPRDVTQVWDRRNLLFDVSQLNKVKKKNAVLQDVVPKSPTPGFKLLVRYVDSLCSRLEVPLDSIQLIRHDGREVEIDGANIIGSGGKSLVLRRSEEAAVYKVSGKTRIEREYLIHAFVDDLPCIRPMLDSSLYGEVRGAGEGLSWLTLAGYGREIQRDDLQNSYESLWNDGERAVDSIHQRGILHRDIKPANFLIFGQQLRLNDFDASCFATEDSPDVLKQRVGTPYFESPFFDEEKGYQYRDDWCSLVLSFLHLQNLYRGKDPILVLEEALIWEHVPYGVQACIRWINSLEAAEGRKRLPEKRSLSK